MKRPVQICNLLQEQRERPKSPRDFAGSVEEEVIRPVSAVRIAAAPPGARSSEERLLKSSPEMVHLSDLSRDDLIAR